MTSRTPRQITKQHPLLVIPARGGSRGIPRKPLAIAGGRPLLWYTFDFVRRLDLTDWAVVITDDNEIAVYASANGFPVVREPLVKSERECTARAAYNAVQAIEQTGRTIQYVVLLQPTQPVRPLDVVQRCVNAIGGEVDAAMTVHPVDIPPEIMAEPDHGVLRFPNYRKRQDCVLRYQANGVCNAWRREAYNVEPTSLTDFHRRQTYRAVVTERFPHVDIDDPHDLEYFEYLLEHGHTIWNPVGACALPRAA